MRSDTLYFKVIKFLFSNNYKCMLWRVADLMGLKVKLFCFRNYEGVNGFYGYRLF